MAEVFLAKAEGPGGFEKTLVVKRILPQLAAQESFVEMFLSEARIAAQLSHQNIIQVFDFGEEDGSYFLAMEYVDGVNLRTLNRWLKDAAPLSLAHAVQIVLQVCDGLAWAHDFVNPSTGAPMGLVHRDISVENIMITRTGAVKVLDFGLARAAGEDNGTRSGLLKGKLACMPIEQLRALELDRRADVYAVGVVLYQLISQHQPFERPTKVALINAILTEAPTPVTRWRPEVPTPLVTIIERAMAKDREHRFADCRALRTALERWLLTSGPAPSHQDLATLATRAMASEVEREALATRGGTVGIGGGSNPALTGVLARSGVSSLPELGEDDPEVSAVQPLALGDSSDQTDLFKTVVRADDSTSTSVMVPPALARAALAATAPSAPAAARPIPVLAPVAAVVGVPLSPPSVEVRGAGLEPRGFEDAQVLVHVRKVDAPPAVLNVLRDGVKAHRAQGVLRQLPLLVARLMQLSPELNARLTTSVAGLVDAALLADEHVALATLVEGFGVRGGPFAEALWAELSHPLRLFWLVERLKDSQPKNIEGLQLWLGRPGAQNVAALLAVVERCPAGPPRDLLCVALAHALGGDATPVIARLEAPGAQVVPLIAVLEALGAADRTARYEALVAKGRVTALQVLEARAHAPNAEVFAALMTAAADEHEATRLEAVRLICQTGDKRSLNFLLTQVQHPLFDKRGDDERTAWWAAIFRTNHPVAFVAASEQLDEKTTLLGRKRSIATKLAIVSALSTGARAEAAKTLLEEAAANKSQPDEVVAAAKQALAAPAAPRRPDPAEALAHLDGVRRAFVLELAMMANAMSVIDVAGGLLDPAIERLRSTIQALASQGKLELRVSKAGVAFNGVLVPLTAQGVDHGPALAQRFERADLQALIIESPLSATDLRALLLSQFDPDGPVQRVARVRVETFSGRVQSTTPAPISNPVARSPERWRAAYEVIAAQREPASKGLPISLQALGPVLDEAARVYDGGGGHLLAVAPRAAGDDALAVHGANTAAIAMSFASDLHLGRAALRDAAQLALVWALAELRLPPERRTRAGEAPIDEVRVPLATLGFAELPSRRGPAHAVSCVDLWTLTPGRAPALVPTIVAIAEAWDSLALRDGLGHAAALDLVETLLRGRFTPEVLDLFLPWARAQGIP
jgi:serine/threonine-protein kinase